MSSRSSISEPAYLGKTIVVALTIVIVVAGEINHPLWTARICPKEGRSSSSESEISSSSVQCVLSSPLPKCRMPKGGSTHSDTFALKVSAAYGRAFAVRKQITSRGRLGSGSQGIAAVAQDCKMWVR